MLPAKTIKNWIKQAKKNKATHLMIVFDRNKLDNFPVEVSEVQDVKQVTKKYENTDYHVEWVYRMAEWDDEGNSH